MHAPRRSGSYIRCQCVAGHYGVMSFNSGDTLGNHRFVARAPVTYFATGKTQLDTLASSKTTDLGGSSTAAMVPRGRLLCISSKDDVVVAADMSSMTGGNAKQQTQGSKFRTFGVMAEAMADNTRRTRRPGNKPVDLVLPVTFQGIDIVTAPCITQQNKAMATCDAFSPGDTVYAVFGDDPADIGYRLSKDPPSTLTVAHIRIGVCHVGTTGGSEVQVMVDSMAASSLH